MLSDSEGKGDASGVALRVGDVCSGRSGDGSMNNRGSWEMFCCSPSYK